MFVKGIVKFFLVLAFVALAAGCTTTTHIRVSEPQGVTVKVQGVSSDVAPTIIKYTCSTSSLMGFGTKFQLSFPDEVLRELDFTEEEIALIDKTTRTLEGNIMSGAQCVSSGNFELSREQVRAALLKGSEVTYTWNSSSGMMAYRIHLTPSFN